MKKAILLSAIAVAFASCESPAPVIEKVKATQTTTVRSYTIETPDSTFGRTEFDEYNVHQFNTDTKMVTYTEGVNNQPMTETMDYFDFSADSTNVAFYKTYPNGTELALYYEVGKVVEVRAFPNGSTKRTIFELK